MKMVGLNVGGVGGATLLMILASHTCVATTSSKPEFTDLTNGSSSSFEPSSAIAPVSTPQPPPPPTPNGRLSTLSATTANVILAVVHNAPTEQTDAAVTSTHTPTEAAITGTATPHGGSGEAGAGAEEYYSSYDYPDTNNHTGYTHKEPGVIPDPNTQDSFSGNRVTILDESGVARGERESDEGEEEEVSLPDDSLADTDLHDHDLIDSVMYIYFGSSRQASGTAGRQVLIVGAAVSLMAQFFALASIVRRLSVRSRETSTLIFLGTELAMTSSNLIFMLGVQATDKHRTCGTVALLLHYLYLVSSCCLFSISVHVYQRLRTAQDARLRWCWPLAGILPAALVMACYMVNPRGYETHLYCWMSVERGMVLSFMVPMSTLILLNATITVLCQRLLSRNDVNKQCDFDGSDVTLRSSLLAAAMLLPVFAVAWFLRVVALENGESVAVPVLAALTDAFLNWYIFLRSHVLLPYREPPDETSAVDLLSDNDVQPLLSPEMSPIHVVAHGARRAVPGELLELRLDAISTITT